MRTSDSTESSPEAFSGLEFHQVCELERRADGWQLQRLPAAVRAGLDPHPRMIAQDGAGQEIRFVSDHRTARLTLLAAGGADQFVRIYRGDLQLRGQELKAGVPTFLHLDADPIEPALLARSRRRFAPDVWRICGDWGPLVFVHFEAFGAKVRPPTAAEKPTRTLLVHGSSITQGASVTRYSNCYAQQTAMRLRMDLINLGLSGACFVEYPIADHIAARHDWHVCLLELGVNVRGRMDPPEFRQRADYFVDTIRSAHPDKPLFLVTPFLNREHLHPDPINKAAQHQLAYAQHLRDIVSSRRDTQLRLIEGDQILDDPYGLTCDLIHPSDTGHILMGQRMAEAIEGGQPLDFGIIQQ